jgi:hypothetical protein
MASRRECLFLAHGKPEQAERVITAFIALISTLIGIRIGRVTKT